MILSFGDKATEALYHGEPRKLASRFPPGIRAVALRRLDMLNAARELRDLRSPPANRLERLRADLRGFHSIRINDQWRVVFRWHRGDAEGVRIVDYH